LAAAMHFIQWGWQSQPNWIIEHQTKKGTVRMTVNKVAQGGFILISLVFIIST